MTLDLRASELEHKFIKERINTVGKHFAEISSKLSSYVNKLANVRDSGDEVAHCISNFASKETFNQTLRLGFGEFSDVLYSIQEYRTAQIQRTHTKVVHEFDCYDPACKQLKGEIKKCFDARVKELKKKNELEKTRSKAPPNWQKIAEKEVNQAQEEANHMTQEMGKLFEQFEKKKLEDLKKVFLEFVKIEMIFHAKAIELYTKAYSILQEIKIEEDLHEFNSHFKALTSSLDAEAISPSKCAASNTVNETPKHSPDKPEVFKGASRRQRSVFTLKSSMPDSDDSVSVSGASGDAKFESVDLN